MTTKYTNVSLKPDGSGFTADTIEHSPMFGQPMTYAMSASFTLFLIRQAWERSGSKYGEGAHAETFNAIERLADGFGPGAGTHGDWSGIRDSSPAAIEKMFAVALNALFG